jgi:formamidopyrimidine-DNA glycosylase
LLVDMEGLQLIMHMGMTGQLAVKADRPASFRHLCVRFLLDDGASMWFNDQRRFGWLVVTRHGQHESIPTLHRMGPEPLGPEFDVVTFTRQVARTRGIKAALLSQRIVAGVGNIYADEALFLAGLHPEQMDVGAFEARQLHDAIREVLSHGIINRGTTFKDYRDGMGRYGQNQDFLRVFDRTGKPCVRCSQTILKIRVAQRGTHFCPGCQSRR